MSNISNIEIGIHSKKAYLEYSIAVLKGRAIPFIHDGQKPVNRRILHVMNELNLKSDGQPKKSARIVGDVIGKYHPHGDSAVYEAMVKMSQDFYLRYPLVDGQGNFGSRDGDSAAAMRYTEAKLSPIAEILLNDLKYHCVDLEDNFDNTLQEPKIMPSRLNMLLMNGTQGIAVGMATSIPSHNINDVKNATIAYINNENISDEELAENLYAPDLPTGGQIISPLSDIHKAYSNGEGTFTVRCRWRKEEQGRGQYRIVITELPPSSSVESVLQKIDALENPKGKKDKNGKVKKLSNKELNNKTYIQNLISNAYNDSEGKDLRLVIEPKSSRSNAEEVMEKLYKILELEENVKIDMTTVGTDFLPRRKNLKQFVSEWVNFRFETVTKRFQYLLNKTNDRIHILEGRKIAFDNLNEVINIIRNSDEPQEELETKYGLSETQAKDILEIRLRQLARLEIQKIEKELTSLLKDKKRYESLLNSKTKMMNLIKKEIEEDTAKFSDERRTLVKEAEKATINEEEKIVDEKVSIIVNNNGWLTLRKGHDIETENLTLKDSSPIFKILETRSTNTIAIFSKNGRVFNIKPYQIPSGKNFIHINTLIESDGSELIDYKEIDENKKILFANNNGYGFIIKFKNLVSKNKAGKQVFNLEENIDIPFKPIEINNENTVLCLSSDNRLLAYNLKEIKELPNRGKGVQLIKLPPSISLVDIKIIEGKQVTLAKNVIDLEEEGYFNKRARRGKTIDKIKDLSKIKVI
tara:strand:- start:123650 stop:125902 length:2253 start_codon:yes stop_codon:yes gene_type:complete